uniref:Uncharacterized protein n=1 Tax=Timema douglasi TaxID=61478 RepID=A0A7R8VI15_TIMDO|nr:unnamed protein product [Timema douglasi]
MADHMTPLSAEFGIIFANRQQLLDKPIKSLLEEAATLERHLHGRHPPKEEHELKILSHKVEQDIDSRSKIDISVLSEESRKHVLKIKQKQVRRRFHECVYHWKPIPYNHHKGLLYLLGRAAREVWGNSLHEYFNVDCCAEMNNLASLLLRDGKEDREMPLKGVFYRQFLPASHSLKYDIVVSAYSLFELPSSESRLETILALWNKTQAYLVIVEQGTNAGFKCPHDLSCPRFIRDDIPCNFEATYSPLTFGRNPEFKKERYSYVILKKGHRPVEDRQWPRLVSPTLIRHKHAICRMCSSAGKLDEIIFTVSRHGKSSYKCARASKWGDLLPIKVESVNGSQETNADKIDSGSQETNPEKMDSEQKDS